MILSQVGGRLSIVMLLPSMAFSAVSGLNVYVSVWLMGTVTVIYCLKGGMKAVVWTDVLQFLLVYGTIAFALVTIAHDVPGGLSGLLSVAHAEGKFKAFLFDWDFVRPTVWVFSCLAVTTVFLQLSDQALMQRALSAPDEKAARNSVVLAGVLNLPVGAHALLHRLGPLRVLPASSRLRSIRRCPTTVSSPISSAPNFPAGSWV